MKKILLACPVSDYKAYVILDWLAYIKQHFSDQCDILLIDNSKKVTFCRMIKKTGAAVIWRPPRKGELLSEVMADCINIINRALQRGGYTHLFSVECDVFPPAGTLDLLKAYDPGIIAASYCINFAEDRKMMYQVAEGIEQLTIRNMTQRESFGYVDGSIRQVLSPGLGCTLIRAEILKDYTFYTDEKVWKVHADSFFFRDMRLKKQPVYVHTGIICKHLNSTWNDINTNYQQRTAG
jgi:hypothetical protein